jgi:Tol biopolymer transport system component
MSTLYEDRGGTSATRLDLGPLPVEHVALSPDGFWIAFQGKDVGGATDDLFIITITGAERTRLTTDPGNDFDPAWRPAVTP